MSVSLPAGSGCARGAQLLVFRCNGVEHRAVQLLHGTERAFVPGPLSAIHGECSNTSAEPRDELGFCSEFTSSSATHPSVHSAACSTRGASCSAATRSRGIPSFPADSPEFSFRADQRPRD